ncbi:MAG: hypothetical protein DMD74_01005 [Gemmatimonadetes bacterium]|nr:MAG: hypothetical protein DMD74_01005 [Gemmatimonadota bacterium]
MNVQSQTAVVSSSQLVWRRVAAVTLGTALVAAAAQVTGVISYAVGRLVGDGTRTLRVALAALAGLALIHLGGLAQLVILTGSAAQAARLGTLPFVAGDLGKLAIAVLVLRPTVSAFRARL